MSERQSGGDEGKVKEERGTLSEGVVRVGGGEAGKDTGWGHLEVGEGWRLGYPVEAVHPQPLVPNKRKAAMTTRCTEGERKIGKGRCRTNIHQNKREQVGRQVWNIKVWKIQVQLRNMKNSEVKDIRNKQRMEGEIQE